MNRILTVILALLLLCPPFQTEARDNPFISKKAPKKEVRLPTIASKVLAKIAVWQQKLNTKLTEQVRRLKTDRSWGALWPLIVMAFFHGIVHAAGPGHGKVVVFSYFMSRRSSIKKGFLLGNLISFCHAVSGVIIVLILYFVIKTAYLSSFETISEKIKLVSYSLVVLIGLVLLFNSLFHIKKRPSRLPEEASPATASDHKGALQLALAVGMVPCPGVVIIMLFALSFNLPATGLMMSLIMALGMAATISFAGLLSILGQEGLLKGLSKKERAQYGVQKGLAIFGSLLIIGFGSVLWVGAL
jgi:ABC-type nickel/cobalt efflux system permease component RcnA